MTLNIENPEVERLAAELARLTGETKTETIRKALEERRRRLAFQADPRQRGERFLRFLAEEVWPNLPAGSMGQRPTRDEEDEILGYGSEGV